MQQISVFVSNVSDISTPISDNNLDSFTSCTCLNSTGCNYHKQLTQRLYFSLQRPILECILFRKAVKSGPLSLVGPHLGKRLKFFAELMTVLFSCEAGSDLLPFLSNQQKELKICQRPKYK